MTTQSVGSTGDAKPNAARSCSCAGLCQGKESLGDGWYCVLDKQLDRLAPFVGCPYDSFELATVEWLKSQSIEYGGEDDKPNSLSYTQGGAGGPGISLWYLDKMGFSSALVASNPTRGKVRALMAALEVKQ